MENKIKEIILREFDSDTINIRRITEGYSHFMYDVKITKDPYELIIRFSNNKNEEVTLEKEKYVMEILNENGIPAPKIYVFNEEYMIMERIKGIRLDTIWDSMTADEKTEISEKIGKFVSKIHKIKFDNYGKILAKGKIKCDSPFTFRNQGEKIGYNKFARELLKDSFQDFARLLSYPDFQIEIIEEIFTYIKKNIKKIIYDKGPVLVHGDYTPDHLFVEKTETGYEIVGIIDFEFAAAYPAEYDFIKLHRKGFFEDESLKESLEKGYGRNVDKDLVEFFRVLRDLGFAWAVLESGNKELSDKTLESIRKRIK